MQINLIKVQFPGHFPPSQCQNRMFIPFIDLLQYNLLNGYCVKFKNDHKISKQLVSKFYYDIQMLLILKESLMINL